MIVPPGRPLEVRLGVHLLAADLARIQDTLGELIICLVLDGRQRAAGTYSAEHAKELARIADRAASRAAAELVGLVYDAGSLGQFGESGQWNGPEHSTRADR
jgi:hypothetical protein